MANYRMDWYGRDLWGRRMRAPAARGLQQGLEHVLAESNKIVPLDEGTLERSGTVDIDPYRMVGAVSYDTPYAVRQHEELTWRHAPGRQAKFLETALNSNRAEVARMVQTLLKQAID